MSYTSVSFLPATARLSELREFVQSLGYNRSGAWTDDGQRFEFYGWFDDSDYRSWSGIQLTIYLDSATNHPCVEMSTPVSRSYYDLVHQNNTVSAIRRRFGGSFRTDEGTGRYLRPGHEPPSPAASGCHLAFQRFGHNLIKAASYLSARDFKHSMRVTKATPPFLQEMDPQALSNNMVVSFLVSIVEDYLKSSFVALLRYSPQKDRFLRGVRLQGDQLTRVADGEMSVEQIVSEMLPFQRVSAASRHFEALDKELDLAGTLRRPYRRRRQSFFDLLEDLVQKRHAFVHRAKLDLSVSHDSLFEIVYDLEVAVTRIYAEIAQRYQWPWDKFWFVGRRTRKVQKSESQKGAKQS